MVAAPSEMLLLVQIFYGILMQHFIKLSARRPIDMSHLDALASALMTIAAEVPFFAATVARAQLQKLHEILSNAFADPLTNMDHGWPSATAFLQLQLFATIFPLSDRRHPVVTPMALLAGKYLSFCPMTCPRDVAKGLAVCNMSLHLASPARRYSSEMGRIS